MKSILFSISTLLASNFANAFTLNSTNNSNFQGWDNPDVSFSLNLANCPASVDVRGIVDDALAIWNNVPSSRVKLSLAADTSSTSQGNPIPIICDTNFASLGGGAEDSSPGVAQITPDSSGTRIVSGIMRLNASSGQANIANFSRAIVAVTLAHEIGHLIGLGHSQDDNALMYFDASAKSYLGLAQDDIDGVSYLYPRNELGQDQIAGCGLIRKNSAAPPNSSSGKTLWLALLALLLPMIIWMRLKKVVVRF